MQHNSEKSARETSQWIPMKACIFDACKIITLSCSPYTRPLPSPHLPKKYIALHYQLNLQRLCNCSFLHSLSAQDYRTIKTYKNSQFYYMWMSKELQVLYFSFNLSNNIQGLEFLPVKNFDSNLVSRQLMFCHFIRMRKEFNKLFPICFTFTSMTTGRSLDDIKSCLQFIIIWINTDQSQFLRKQT